ncbi:MAG TPA: ABC transporter ATP-binding protein, partial [Candidatus Coprosoma intestinipullorum]|nr:ABC transporter ATP-binding protein [Candidatus Coprosoma intestinipullorum]
MNKRKEPYLELLNLVKSYQSNSIFKGESISFYNGTTLLAGPNGAGKSTLIKLILGLISANSGEIRLFGRDISKTGLNLQEKKKVGLQLQNDSFLKAVKVSEYIELYQRLYGITSERYSIEKIRDILSIDQLLGRYAFNLSGGEKKKVSLFLALIGDKDLIILDEPTAGIDVEVKVKIIEVLNYLCSKGINIIVSSHDLEDFFENSDHLLLINRGKIFEGDEIDFLKKFKNVFKVEYSDALSKKFSREKTNLFG